MPSAFHSCIWNTFTRPISSSWELCKYLISQFDGRNQNKKTKWWVENKIPFLTKNKSWKDRCQSNKMFCLSSNFLFLFSVVFYLNVDYLLSQPLPFKMKDQNSLLRKCYNVMLWIYFFLLHWLQVWQIIFVQQMTRLKILTNTCN